jgi:hypothetical protein
MDTRPINLAGRYADPQRLRREVHSMEEDAAQVSRAKRARLQCENPRIMDQATAQAELAQNSNPRQSRTKTATFSTATTQRELRFRAAVRSIGRQPTGSI